MVTVIIYSVCVYFATIGFGLLINLPRKALNMAGIVSLIGWLVFHIVNVHMGGYLAADILGTFTVGILSIFASRYKKMPVIIFNIPALVPLVPGGQAYQVMKCLAIGNYALAKSNLIQVIFIAGGIASGFLFAEFLNQLYLRLKTYLRTKKATR
ncbi:hypothetical protein AKUG0406_11430 [Apilactobacillus kunkeei]|uniref:Threonine/Serine exporter ThrE domain-containing protein n=1 Tax=Apilactobacillus kunkeei EFB6 TaxID=1419324 RepID=A0A836YU70_9LACO|nr:threonine/serine exporter family protein [Apilactobacillus kunkeei]KDB00346.1 hypothetical protein LAKU_30c00100 [Apilactobacillus kunkeei EFB6]KOY71020.1 uncharacterized protein RZ55_01010 [Apilactobacillus kunkeei]KOY72327.1 uncharacterized protein RZ54_00960 [Apilactobacillus kunkeei]KOY77285.1 uncharacterized protein RZ75_00950 [Apilactobacillus kunkeei]KPN80888.1 uncharacterized protein RZ76_01010 [Apilactobacillus kunkeei]